MRVLYPIPWSSSKDLGEHYNWVMTLVGDDDYVCFTDGDTTFTTAHYGKQIEDIITKYPECGLFTSRTNRVNCTWQRYGDWDSNDMKYHREVGLELFQQQYDAVMDVSNVPRQKVLSGVLILISKRVWKAIGGFQEGGMLGIDNDIHWKAMDAGERVYLMLGVYLYHWYRGGNKFDKGHLL
jgi:GT2 family glycosyltransferase